MKLRSKSSIYDVQRVFSEDISHTVCMAYRKNPDFPWIRDKVLLKIFQKDSVVYPLALDSLLQVKSPYCVCVLNFETIENKPSLVLEWVDGVNLFQLLRQSPALSHFEISYICLHIQKGLMDLKNHGLSHGDLSLSNVLIDRKGRIRLIDFGKSNYMSSHVFATPCFVAPEVFKGERPSFYSDLFSLGVLEKLLHGYEEKTFENQKNSIEGDPLLDPEPQNRMVKEFVNDSKSEITLAQKVNLILNKLHFTKNTFQKPSVKKYQRKPLSYLISLAGATIIGLTGSSIKKDIFGSISVRSHKWMHITVGGKSGFTPFESGPIAPGKYFLVWRNHFKKGKKQIHIKKNSHILLTDQDF